MVAFATVVALSACGSGSPPSAAATVKSSPAPSPIEAPTPTTAASPTGSNGGAFLPLTTLDFTCRLPISSGSPPSDAFLSLPGRVVTSAGQGNYWYDAFVSRWLPVTSNDVSPDGSRYALTEGWSFNPPKASRVHVVDARTGNDVMVVSMPDLQPYFVLDFTDRGVDIGIAYEGRGPGVWRLNVETGGVSKISDGLYPPDAEWQGALDTRDPSPYISASGLETPFNRIDRHDPSGSTTAWFLLRGHTLGWAQFAASTSLLVQATWQDPTDPTKGGVEYWLVSSPTKAAKLVSYRFSESSPYSDLNFGWTAADPHGIWVGGEHSLYLVTSDGSILRVYDSQAHPAGTCG